MQKSLFRSKIAEGEKGMSFEMISTPTAPLRLDTLQEIREAMVFPESKVESLSSEFFAALRAEDSSPIAPEIRVTFHDFSYPNYANQHSNRTSNDSHPSRFAV